MAETKTESEVLLEQIEQRINTQLATRASKEDIKTQIAEQMVEFNKLPLEGLRALADETNGAMATLIKQGLEITELRAKFGGKAADAALSVRAQIKELMQTKKTEFDSFRASGKGYFGADKDGSPSIVISNMQKRAATTMTVSGSTNGSVFVPTVELMPGFVDLYRNQPFLEDFANASTTTSSRIVWTQKTDPQGTATFTAEGAAKSQISVEIETAESYAKKVAAYVKVSTEMWDDIDFIAALIQGELAYQVDIETDDELLSGNGDGSSGNANLQGIVSQASGYVLTSITTTTPNDFDAIRAMLAQCQSLNFKPTNVFFSQIDYANMDIIKDSYGRPLADSYRTDDGKIFGLTPFASNQMPVGYCMVADMSKFFVRNYQPFRIMFGWVDDDFTNNLFTIIGERRLHSFIRSNEINAFCYDSFANVKTAITA